MLFVALISWWYGAGWRDQASLLGERLARVADRYSIELLAGSLFAPFRQLDAGGAGGPLNVRLRAWLDKLVSRFIGAMVRLTMIVTGVVVFVGSAAVGTIWLLVWPLLPAAPLFGLWLMNVGWLPWSLYV